METDYSQVNLTVNDKTVASGKLSPGQVKRITELTNHFVKSNILYETQIKGKL